MKKKELYLLIYNIIVSAIVLSIINIFDLRDSYGLMLVYSVNSLFVFGLIGLEEVTHFRGLNMRLLVLVGCSVRFVLPAITKSWGAINGEEYAFLRPENVVTDYMFPTVVWMNIYYSIFYWCFVVFDSGYTIEDKIKPFFKSKYITLLAIIIFVIGIVYNIVTSFIPAGLIPSFINSLVGQFATLGILVQLFQALFNPSRFNKRVFLIFIIISVWQTIAYGFYKGAIMINFVYYIIYYFLDCKYNNKRLLTPKLVFAAVLLFLTIDIIVFPFMTTKRIVADWDAGTGLAANKYSNLEILSDVIKGKSLSERGDNTAASRLDAIEPNAFFYKECCVRGLRTSKIARNNIELLVPRFINPNKHNSEAGLMVYAYATTGSFDNVELALSNNYIGQFASAYLIGGGLLAILLAFVNGWFLMIYYNFLLRHMNNLIAIILFIPLILSALLAFEEIHDGGFLRMGYNGIMMLALWLLTFFFPHFLTIRSKCK